MSFTIYPAMDLRKGAVVRLHQGDYEQETRYDSTPQDLAHSVREQGAEWMHIVDLDGARSGAVSIHSHVRAITDATGLKVQVGGGVREFHDIEALLAEGAKRVVLGSVAVREPERVIEWLREIGPEKLTIALDTRQDPDGQWRLAVHGWTENTTRTLFTVANTYAQAGLKHLLCTDISRDGTLSGPATDLYAELHQRFPHLAVQASGGIRDLNDLQALRTAGCAGAIVGKSLLDGKMTVREALGC